MHHPTARSFLRRAATVLREAERLNADGAWNLVVRRCQEAVELALRGIPKTALSAQTTPGFASLEVAHLSSAAKLMLLPAMFTGGAVGSTAGGIKMLRAVILLRLAQV